MRNLIFKQQSSRQLILIRNSIRLLLELQRNLKIKTQCLKTCRPKLTNSQSLKSSMRAIKKSLNIIINIIFGELDKIVEFVNRVLRNWFDIETLFVFLLFDSLEIFLQSLVLYFLLFFNKEGSFIDFEFVCIYLCSNSFLLFDEFIVIISYCIDFSGNFDGRIVHIYNFKSIKFNLLISDL